LPRESDGDGRIAIEADRVKEDTMHAHPRLQWTGAVRIGVGVAVALLGLTGLGIALTTTAPSPALRDGATLRMVEDAAVRGDRAEAERVRRALHGRALASRQWQDWLAAGHAALVAGDGAPDAASRRATARRAYRNALFAARDQGSVPGVLLVAEAFARLGDHEVAESARRIAERIPDAGHAADIEPLQLADDQLTRLTRPDSPTGRIEP
jgi:hypothetical protein